MGGTVQVEVKDGKGKELDERVGKKECKGNPNVSHSE